jgi:hypothetical protein
MATLAGCRQSPGGEAPIRLQVSARSEGPSSLMTLASPADGAAVLFFDSGDSKTVHLAARLFSEDVERVCGIRPELKAVDKKSPGEQHPVAIIIGSLGQSRLIQDLVERDRIDVGEIIGQWEACLIEVVDHPFKGIDQALVIAGSDRRGVAYGLLGISEKMGVSPWHFFADVPPAGRDEITIDCERLVQKSPSVKYRGIFINDEMWGLRPWAMHRYAPEEGKGLGPKTHARIFELLLRLKANTLWPAMHQQTRPFYFYEENKAVADEYGIVIGTSHIEPMLRNNIGGAEWDQVNPGQPWDYVKNRQGIYDYWEGRVREAGKYENIYTLGKRGQDDVPGSEVTVPVLQQILSDQRQILRRWVDDDITRVPQVLIPYTEVLGLYNDELQLPEDVIICWPDDNFGYIRQLPNESEQQRSGGSGIYYHFQWLNGSTTAYPWLHTTPPALTWTEMMKAYEHGARELWIVNVGDIKPMEIGIEHFMRLAWDIESFRENDPHAFLVDWARRDFGAEHAEAIADIMMRHFELGFARRPEHMVMKVGGEENLKSDWFSLWNYGDEAQERIDAYEEIMTRVEEIYEALPDTHKDAFFQMVVYNVKGAALHNQKVLYAQKSEAYGKQKRASAATYAARAQEAEKAIFEMIHHYNREQVTVGDKWDRMASLPGPWGVQWRQFEMPPTSSYSGEGLPHLALTCEGGNRERLPAFSVYQQDRYFIDLYNTGNGCLYWEARASDDWIQLSRSSGVLYDEERIWVTIDWDKAPKDKNIIRNISFRWRSSNDDRWQKWPELTGAEQKAYVSGEFVDPASREDLQVGIHVFNPETPRPGDIKGFVESHGVVSMEAENFSRKVDRAHAAWEIIEGLGRSGDSVTVRPTNIPRIYQPDKLKSSSPALEYDFYAFTPGSATLHLHCLPTLPIHEDYRLAIALALNDEPLIILSRPEVHDHIDNLMLLKTRLPIPEPGQHTLKLWMIDPGVVIDKIILDTGGLKESYLGPPESALFP